MRVSVSQVDGVSVIAAGSDGLTAHSSGLRLQKWTQPGTGMTGRCLMGAGLDEEGSVRTVWAFAPPLSASATARVIGRSPQWRNGRAFTRRRRDSRMTPPCRYGCLMGPHTPSRAISRQPLAHLILTSGYSHVLAEEGRHGFELLHKPDAAENLSRVLRRMTGSRKAR